MFIIINRINNQESTININEIVELRVLEVSENDKYVTIFMTNNGYVDITFKTYEELLKVIPLYATKCKVNVPQK